MNDYSDLSTVIIEDTPTKAAVLKALLEEAGVNKIKTFETGSAGLAHLSKVKDSCLLFLDLMLPDISGQEILQHLAEQKFKGFVVINSLCEPRIVQTALNVAANSGVRLLGALNPNYSIEQLTGFLDRANGGPENRRVRADHVLLDEESIHKAFDDDRIVPFFQPIINMQSQKVVALECLARIIAEDGEKILSPISFLSHIYDMAFLDNLALRLFSKALKALSTPYFASSNIKIALNIDPCQLLSGTFMTTLQAMTEHADIAPSRIIFELTEQSPIDQDIQLESINILRLKGYDIAIDDFGSGYTNISNLHNIPFNRLKVDRQLLHNINNDSFCQIAIDSILAMAHEVQADVVFEGIEYVEQVVYSARHEGVSLQGYYLCKPVAEEDLIKWIETSPYSLPEQPSQSVSL